MNKLYSSALVFILFIYGVEASAQQSIWTIHPSICEAIHPIHSSMLKWRPEGLVNRDPSTSVWVMCPVMSKFFDSDSQDSYFDVAVASENPQPVKVNCILRVIDVNTERLTSYSQTKTMTQDGAANFIWELQNKSLVAPSISCKLPPGGLIGGIIAGYVDF